MNYYVTAYGAGKQPEIANTGIEYLLANDKLYLLLQKSIAYLASLLLFPSEAVGSWLRR